jgi:hypothetical protein
VVRNEAQKENDLNFELGNTKETGRNRREKSERNWCERNKHFVGRLYMFKQKQLSKWRPE